MIASRCGHVSNRVTDFFFRERVERRSSLVEDQQLRLAQKRPRDGEPLLLAAGNFDAAFADHGIEAAVGARQQAFDGGLAEDIHAFRVGGVGTDEKQVLANGPENNWAS